MEETPDQLAEDVRYFSANIDQKLVSWKQYLEQMQPDDRCVVIWGSGSKCVVAFLSTLGTEDQVECVVDINPHRHGEFIPGLGKEIISPDFPKVINQTRS